MIWHFLEVWVLMLAAFAIGCPIGAIAYDLVARSPASGVQGSLANSVGDVVDGIKSRLGVGPVWRPEYRRIVERPQIGASNLRARDALENGRAIAADDDVAEDRGARVPSILADDDVWSGDEGADILDDEVRVESRLLIDHEPPRIAGLLPPAKGAGVVDGDDIAAARPVGLATPRNGVPDDLQRIRGIGERNERRLNALGIYHFGQIAAWTPAEMRWVAQQLAFPERVERDDWIGQAVVLASGGDTGFVKSADRRRQRRQEQLSYRDEGAGEIEAAGYFDEDESAHDGGAGDPPSEDST